MIRVLIADDEPKIRAGLREMLLEFDIGIEICGEARNGLEALSIMQIEKPDLIIADISMPKLNGIDMIKKIRETDSRCKIIIITGFDKFDYALQAVELGVSKYFLKPIDEDKLLSCLNKVTSEIMERERLERIRRLASFQIQKNNKLLVSQFFRDLVGNCISHNSIADQMDLLGIELDEDCCLVMLGSGQMKNEAEVKEIASKIEAFLGDRDNGYVFVDEDNNIVVLAEKDIVEELKYKFQDYTYNKLFAVRENVSLSNLLECYKSCHDFIMQESAYDDIVIIAKKYVEEHYACGNLVLKGVSDAIGYSSTYLSKMMKKDLGMSFIDYLTNVRITKACELMSNTNDSMNVIAEKVGYSTQHYFSTIFKNVMGVSPSEYRRKIWEER